MKIIIWGHKLHQSTHSYIHSSYYRVFQYLGHEVYWLDKTDNVDLDWGDAVFFLEDSVKDGVPINKTARYITHHIDTEYFINLGIPYENILKLGNYLPALEKHEKVNDLAYWDESQRCLYQCWGTDLLPDEIDIDSTIKFNPDARTLNYIGMLYEQGPWWVQNFADIIYKKHKVEFTIFTQNASDEENRQLIQQSFLCPDFRSDWHLQCGYIPCRIFKNISYGRITGTNSPYVKAAFGDFVVFGGTPNTLYENLLSAEVNSTVNMRDAMNLVKEKHTFVNRINNILRFL
jgi:glycosyltransferase involved in cell wall biosynthesis